MVPRLLTRSYDTINTASVDRDERTTYSLGHADTGVLDGESLVCLIRDDIDPQVFARVELAGVGKGLIADLVKRIGRV